MDEIDNHPDICGKSPQPENGELTRPAASG